MKLKSERSTPLDLRAQCRRTLPEASHDSARCARKRPQITLEHSARSCTLTVTIMPESPIVLLPTLLALLAFLYWSVATRWQDQNKRCLAEQRRRLANYPKITAADVSPLTRKIQRLRANPTTALKTIPHQTARRARLLAAARSMFAHFSFFHRDRET